MSKTDPLVEFELRRAEDVVRLTDDHELAALSNCWMQATAKHRYT